jgi:hypothetical protein
MCRRSGGGAAIQTPSAFRHGHARHLQQLQAAKPGISMRQSTRSAAQDAERAYTAFLSAQLAMDAGRAPQRVVVAHPANELAQFPVGSGPANPPARLPAPIGAKSCSMPAQDRLRPNNPAQISRLLVDQRFGVPSDRAHRSVRWIISSICHRRYCHRALRDRFGIGCQACSSSSNAFASFRSRVSNPSVNQP